MKNIDNYLLERLKLNSDSKIKYVKKFTKLEKDDIVYKIRLTETPVDFTKCKVKKFSKITDNNLQREVYELIYIAYYEGETSYTNRALFDFNANKTATVVGLVIDSTDLFITDKTVALELMDKSFTKRIEELTDELNRVKDHNNKVNDREWKIELIEKAIKTLITRKEKHILSAK
jgi:hypothetical protein